MIFVPGTPGGIDIYAIEPSGVVVALRRGVYQAVSVLGTNVTSSPGKEGEVQTFAGVTSIALAGVSLRGISRETLVGRFADGSLIFLYRETDGARVIRRTVAEQSAMLGGRSVLAVVNDKFFLSDGTVEISVLERLLVDRAPGAVAGATALNATYHLAGARQPLRCLKTVAPGYALLQDGSVHRVWERTLEVDPRPVLTGVTELSAASSSSNDSSVNVVAIAGGEAWTWTSGDGSENPARRPLPVPRRIEDVPPMKQAVASGHSFWLLGTTGTLFNRRVDDLPLRRPDPTSVLGQSTKMVAVAAEIVRRPDVVPQLGAVQRIQVSRDGWIVAAYRADGSTAFFDSATDRPPVFTTSSFPPRQEGSGWLCAPRNLAEWKSGTDAVCGQIQACAADDGPTLTFTKLMENVRCEVRAGALFQCGRDHGDPFRAQLRQATANIEGCIPGSEPLSPPVLIDPVTLATDAAPAQLLERPDDLIDKGRVVSGVAADGVARVVVRVKLSRAVGGLTFSLCAEQEDNSCGSGGVSSLGSLAGMASLRSRGPGDTELKGVDATVISAGSAEALVVYKSPTDFVRKQAQGAGPLADGFCPAGSREDDCVSSVRPVWLKVAVPGYVRPLWKKIDIVRPPVVLIHGYNTDQAAWNDFELALQPLASPATPSRTMAPLVILRANYGQLLYQAVPVFTYGIGGPDLDHWEFVARYPRKAIVSADDVTPSVAGFEDHFMSSVRQSHLGFSVSAPCVAYQIQRMMGFSATARARELSCIVGEEDEDERPASPRLPRRFREGDNASGLPVAAAQVDVVAHSMGGLIARQILANVQQRQPPLDAIVQHYDALPFHKLVTIGTPHFGTPQAHVSILPAGKCTREIAVWGDGSLSIDTVRMSKSGAQGARSTFDGANREMIGDGVGRYLSPELANLQARAPLGTVPMALVAGTTPESWKGSVLSIAEDLPACGATDPLTALATLADYSKMFHPAAVDKETKDELLALPASTPHDGAVPLTSALFDDGRSGPAGKVIFRSRFHGSGTDRLMGFALGAGTDHLLDGDFEVVSHIGRLLNASVSDRDRFISIPGTAP